ncbi:Protein CBG01215 [Caenorhabditis briggsae]|uniref:Protein CBG01215 n=1 Tax=Caenorhabditis briggsae TaxID=6238 RepID=A8WPV1_CAEBR|nr:Protein CBG01215 [Caenorhabditis briggsae]CAP22509.2 Protein CBG01215 [Caenorhabditis briggsae]
MKSTTTDLYSKYKDYIEDYYNAEEGTRRGDWVFSIIEKYPIQFYEIVEILKQIYEVASFLSFFINLFHLLILTRKSLRNHLVYLVMIGVCICDILQSLGNMTKILMTWMYQFEICFTGEYYKYSHMIVILLTKTAQIMSRRCSSFLALYIAGVRALSVIFPMSNIVTRWTTPKSGFFAMILVGIICTAWSFIFFKNTKLEKVLYCGIGQPKPSYVPYKFKENSKWEFTYFLIDGYMAMFVSISYAIVAFALVIALAVAKRRSRNLKHENKSNTSGMIILMTVTVLISEISYAVLYLLNNEVFQDFEDQDIFKQLDSFVLTILILSSTVHCIICFFISSQYRDTVKGLFWEKRQEKDITASVVKSTVPLTEGSSKPSNTSN